jgi:hypothetical protein
MKQTKEYKSPAFEPIELDAQDIVTASGGGDTVVDVNAYFATGKKWNSVYNMLF